MKIGNKLRKIRLEKDLKQDAIAHLLGISQSGYNKIERNMYDVAEDKLKEFAEKLEVKPEELMELDEKFIITQHNHQGSTVFGDINNLIHPELKKLYEDKIKLLEEKVAILEKKEV